MLSLVGDHQDDDNLSRSTLSPEIDFPSRGRGSLSEPSGPTAKPTNVSTQSYCKNCVKSPRLRAESWLTSNLTSDMVQRSPKLDR